jgi:hypothetical protein
MQKEKSNFVSKTYGSTQECPVRDKTAFVQRKQTIANDL